MQDIFKFVIHNFKGQETVKLTKRLIMSLIARIYDPIGFAAAFQIRAKIGLQELWQRGVDWDEDLPPSDCNKWNAFFQEIEQLNAIVFQKCISVPAPLALPILVVFANASRHAFGTCAYLRWQQGNDEFSVRFVAVKARVAPLKQLTIPRLELQAAVLASRPGKTIQDESRMKFEKVVLFTDSAIVYAWIKSQAKRFKPFVAARAGEIQNNSELTQWRHIPTDHNSADDVSRGISVKELSQRWQHGPEFLYLPEEEWPEKPSISNADNVECECLKTQVSSTAAKEEEDVIDCERFSSWRRLVRVTANVLRFIQNLGSCVKKSKADFQLGPLSVQELDKAEIYWIKRAQNGLKNELVKGHYHKLSPFTDEFGIIRVGGRIGKVLTSYDSRHPILLPRELWVSTLLTHQAHQYGHPGVATTVAKLRKRFWVIRAHGLAKSVKSRWTFCR